jgi:hypothetical protein
MPPRSRPSMSWLMGVYVLFALAFFFQGEG